MIREKLTLSKERSVYASSVSLRLLVPRQAHNALDHHSSVGDTVNMSISPTVDRIFAEFAELIA
jgi:hypothetical protein